MEKIIMISISVEELQQMIETAVAKGMGINNPNDLSDEYINRQELKEYLGIGSDATIINMERREILKPIRLGRRLMYRKSDLKSVLKQLQRD